MSSISCSHYIRAGTIERGLIRAVSKRSFLSVVMLTFSLVLPGQVWAATRWVDAAAASPTPGTGCGASAGYTTIQAAVSAAAPGDTIMVCAGVYSENVSIPVANLTLNGAQAGNPVAGRTFAVAESTVTGTITIQAAIVTIDGFSLTNPGQSTGILIKTAGNNASIINNIINGIGGVSFSGNTQGIYLEHGPDNVSVVGNRIQGVEGILTSNGGIFIGDSTASNPSLNILIEGNSISDIHSVSRGAYGIQINNGASTAPSAVGFTTVTIRNNTIDNLIGGGWAHAIGLEGDTPGVVVVGNSISNVVDLTPTILGQDAVAVWFEANPSFSTASVNENNFNVTIAAYGIAVHPAIIGTGAVDGTCNWWGDANGPGPVGPGLGARVTTRVNFTPWLTAPASVGACIGGLPSTAGKVTGGGQIPGSDPIFSPLGDLLSVPALLPSLANPNEKATFGFVVRCCPATGNLEYNDHETDVRIKAQSIDALIISNGGCGPNTHATFTGTASVIRSTGTTTEPFTVEVDDCGEPGTADTFSIRTTTYSNGPSTLIGGNIQIHR
ncbi:MAG TPA: post-COAP-1 domain-containing protein [Verrucomicrobiae bacterium]|nr:post-COAP-1 domain-containing protein [Verrucomicrobiae bacterium]